MSTDSEKALTTALVKAQPQLKNATLNKINPHFKSKYADLQSIREATLPALTANDLAIVQYTAYVVCQGTNDKQFGLITELRHKDGAAIRCDYPLPSTFDKPQVLGSALTYARRYSWATICGIAVEEDDEGNAAQKAAKADALVSDVQLMTLENLIDEVHADLEKFLKYLGVNHLAQVPAAKFEMAVKALEQKRKTAGEDV
jgi:hypothetical protein